MNFDTLSFRVHAIKRMAERSISEADVRYVLETGETIERYTDDDPYPSRLLMAWLGSRPLHVVVAENDDDHETIVITAYEPDAKKWETGFKGRLNS